MESNAVVSSDSHSSPSLNAIFRISPIIRITLLGLYAALMLPLPFLSEAVDAPISPTVLWIGISLGAIAVYAALTERVLVDDQQIQVTYPGWVKPIFRKGWSLNWNEVKALKPRTTGQGGLVYYFLSQSGKGYLLPMRIAGFAQLVRIVQQKTGIDTTDVRPLAQPWMYFILFGFTLLLFLIDIWTVTTAFSVDLP
ncbi:MAG: hypothetical protein VKK42_08365 [Lyngbya sp.]|nr:hypothetical protein [Lyngbya sp.]